MPEGVEHIGTKVPPIPHATVKSRVTHMLEQFRKMPSARQVDLEQLEQKLKNI